MKKLFAVLVIAGGCAAGAASAADVVGNAKTAKVEQCIGCHGIPEFYRVPRIGGQSARYIEAALQAYKKGERKHPQMNPTASVLSDQEIADIAAYYSQQTNQ
jgi:cytochrome c553